eukprot:TRINITY_DN1067_c0_g1_i3.p1 TRINITY_DN1067_c0_g1~~TRINITY_DN1067_c0_g1_i3.p1  ORF type:complete len:402 (-),score=50.04 TRINITY_DN1067_c0_g1_i3:32-1237(-)
MKLIGIFFQTSLLVVTLSSIPIGILLYYTEEIFIAMAQNERIAELSGEYVRYLIIGMWPFFMYWCTMRYLQNQRIMLPSMIVGILGILLNVPLNYLCIWGVGSFQGWGFAGTSIATSISRCCLPILLWAYILLRKIHVGTCDKIHWEAFSWKYMSKYLRYAVPAALMVLFEVVGFEGTTILVGLLDDPTSIASHAIGLYVLMISWILPFGWSIGINVHIGNLMGSGEAARAKLVAIFGTTLLVCIMFINSFIVWFGKSLIVKAWTSTENEDVKLYLLAQEILSYASLALIFDGFQFTTGAIVKAVGRQTAGSIFYFIAFYVITIPGGVVLSMVFNFGVVSYWWSLCLGLAVLSTLFTVYILKFIDWDEEVTLAAKRVEYEPIADENGEVDEDDLELYKSKE